LRFQATQVETNARVEFISPLTDAESDTVLVRLSIDNPDGKFRAGDRCELDLRGIAPDLAGATASVGVERRVTNGSRIESPARPTGKAK
jgi:hypothetical protein